MSEDDDSLGPNVVPRQALDDRSLLRLVMFLGGIFLLGLALSALTAMKLISMALKQVKGLRGQPPEHQL